MPASARATGDDSSPMVDTLLKSTSYAMTFLSVDSTSCSPQGLQYKPIESQLWKGTGRPVGVEEDATRRALGGNQRETTWRDAIFEQSFSFAEHHRSDPHAIFVDEIGADQRLQQRAAAPDVQLRPNRCHQPADLVHDIAAYALRGLPAESVEGARDDVFRRLVERLRDRVVALVRPVGGEELVGPTSEQHVELTGDSLANGLVQGVVPEGHDPAPVGEPVPRILLGATGRLHDAVQRDLANGDEPSHCLSLHFSACGRQLAGSRRVDPPCRQVHHGPVLVWAPVSVVAPQRA